MRKELVGVATVCLMAATAPVAAQLGGQPQGLCFGLEPTIYGTHDDDQIEGTAGDDVILLGDGHDVADGKGGNDSICGGRGDDQLLGGEGNDRIKGGSGGWDRLFGEEGADFLTSSSGDPISGGPGDDVLKGGYRLKGGSGDDLYKPASSATIWEGRGNDHVMKPSSGCCWVTLSYQFSHTDMTVDLSEGWARGQGHDTFEGIHSVIGGHGDDLLLGSSMKDSLSGGTGSDRIYGYGGNDRLDDFESYEEDSWDDLLVGGAGDDRIGLAYTPGNDLVRAGKGDDHILGGGGRDRINGGPGSDMLSYWAYWGRCSDLLENDQQGLTIDLREGRLQEGEIDITFERINRLGGTDCNDVLIGAAGDNALLGHAGDDVLYGMAGNDVLYGNHGIDDLRGGKGTDRCAQDAEDTHTDCEE